MPGPIIPISYNLGKKKVLEMLLSGDMIDAAEAESLGLVNRVVPLDKLEAETLAFARKIISHSPLAIQLGKQFYYQMMDMPFSQRFTYSSEVSPGCAPQKMPRKGWALFWRSAARLAGEVTLSNTGGEHGRLNSNTSPAQQGFWQ